MNERTKKRVDAWPDPYDDKDFVKRIIMENSASIAALQEMVFHIRLELNIEQEASLEIEVKLSDLLARIEVLEDKLGIER